MARSLSARSLPARDLDLGNFHESVGEIDPNPLLSCGDFWRFRRII